MKDKLITKWWTWLIGLFALGMTYFFIISMTFSLHPTEIHFYANEEMVATSRNIISISENEAFNECLQSCAITETNHDYDCLMVCNDYYVSKNESANFVHKQTQ